VHVVRFSIGFGKPLLRWRDHRGTDYCLGLFPIGGYVKLLDEREGPVPESMRPYAMQSRNVWQKIGIMIAGPLSNLLLAWVMFWSIFLVGMDQIKPVIAEVVEHTPAAQANMSGGEQIIQADQYSVNNWREITFVIMKHLGRQDSLRLVTVPFATPDQSIQRTYTIDLTDWQINPLHPKLLDSIGLMPLTPKEDPRTIHRVRYSVWQAMGASWAEILFYLKFNAIVIAKLFTGQVSLQSIAGPLTMFYQAGVLFQSGVVVYFYFIAMLSAIIAFINLLPIPGLDGSQILYLLFEKIRGRPVSMATQILIYRLGIIVIIVLCAQVLVYDILRFMLVS
ncbi:MAG: hypothetical protein GKR77_07145, partial [Legionellales bacterium]|nr:hypothetical protein [Legionellales bacterium]